MITVALAAVALACVLAAALTANLIAQSRVRSCFRERATGGAGIGLAITRSLVEAHGGSIRAESEPGRGTTISFTIPAVKTATKN